MGLFRGSRAAEVARAEDALKAAVDEHGELSRQAAKARHALFVASDGTRGRQRVTRDALIRHPHSGARDLFG